MRIVLDTNVFVSAVLKLNSLPFLVVRWIDQHDGLLKSAVTEQEILKVLGRPHRSGDHSVFSQGLGEAAGAGGYSSASSCASSSSFGNGQTMPAARARVR